MILLYYYFQSVHRFTLFRVKESTRRIHSLTLDHGCQIWYVTQALGNRFYIVFQFYGFFCFINFSIFNRPPPHYSPMAMGH